MTFRSYLLCLHNLKRIYHHSLVEASKIYLPNYKEDFYHSNLIGSFFQKNRMKPKVVQQKNSGWHQCFTFSSKTQLINHPHRSQNNPALSLELQAE